MFMMPGGGILAGTLNEVFGIRIGSVLNTRVGALWG
jgi:spermidine/putrescine transport system permease protein